MDLVEVPLLSLHSLLSVFFVKLIMERQWPWQTGQCQLHQGQILLQLLLFLSNLLIISLACASSISLNMVDSSSKGALLTSTDVGLVLQ